MDSFFLRSPRRALVTFLFLDAICVGMGMGVPIFCIALGFPAGWVIVRMAVASEQTPLRVLRKVLRYAAITSACTFAAMAVLWGSAAAMLADPGTNYANFGHPMILYDPKVSFIGWLVLMIFISPFLQLLAMVFGAYLNLLRWLAQQADRV